MKAKVRLTALVALLALVMSACGSAPASPGAASSTAPATAAEEPAQATEAPAQTAAEATEAAAPAEPAAGGDKAKVTFWFDPPEEGEAASCFVETAINGFNQQSQSAEVEAVPQPEAWDATRTALAGGG